MKTNAMKSLLIALALAFALSASAHHDGTDHDHGPKAPTRNEVVLSKDAAHKDHAHAAPSTVVETAANVPMLYAESEQFELVARLYDDELGIYIDRWASNVPLLNAEVEVELNGRKAVARFHEDHGDYAITDGEMIRALHEVGEHALMFTITAGKEADLLTGELHVKKVDAMEALTKKTGGRLLIGAFAVVILTGCGLGVYHLLRARKEGKA